MLWFRGDEKQTNNTISPTKKTAFETVEKTAGDSSPGRNEKMKSQLFSIMCSRVVSKEFSIQKKS